MPKCFLSRDTKEFNRVMANIIGYRNIKGISQSEMGDALGISQQAYSKMEKKKSPMSIEQYLIVCKTLEVKPSEFMERI